MAASDEPVEIKIASSKEEKELVYSFRYGIYIEEMKKNIGSVDFENRRLYDSLDDWGTILYALKGQDIIATIRMNTGTASDFSPGYNHILRLDRFKGSAMLSLITRLMVSPEFRSTSVTYNIMSKGYDMLRDVNVQYAFCLCTPSLVRLYEQLGYRRYAENHLDPELGYRVPMLIVLEDIEYFRSIRSPFYRLARRRENSPEASAYLLEHFPQIELHINTQTIDENAYWSILCSRLNGRLSDRISLFDGLPEEDVQRFMQKSTILRCAKGDSIIRTYDIGDEMFVLLSGAVRVSSKIGGSDHLIVTLEPGSIFGEMGMITHNIRSADITALYDSEVLVISRQQLEKMLIQHPAIVARILLNLSVILSRRLETSTKNWLKAIHQLENGKG